MGESHVRKFVSEGAKVVFTDLNEEGGQALAAELGVFLKEQPVGQRYSNNNKIRYSRA